MQDRPRLIVWYDSYQGRIKILPPEQEPNDNNYHRRGEASNLVAAMQFVRDEFTVLVENYNTAWVDESEKYESVAE